VTVAETTPLGQHPGTQPQPDQLEHPPVTDPPLDLDHQLVLVDRAEEVPDVGLEDELPSSRELHPDPLQCLGGAALRAEPETARQKVGLENRLQDDLCRLLRHPVAHRRNTQRPHPAVRLGNLHPTHRRRAVTACTKITGQLAEHPLNPVILHHRQRHSIDPGGATIGSDPFPRLPQDVTPADAVIQSVETPTLRLLGRSP
jgi:hypothetical protein